MLDSKTIHSLITPNQNDFQYKKQGPSPISLVRATRIFSMAKKFKNNFDLSLDIGDNPIYPFWTGPRIVFEMSKVALFIVIQLCYNELLPVSH